MLELFDFEVFKNQLSMLVCIENEHTYRLTVEMDGDIFPVIESEIPDNFKIYERQARTALMNYINKNYLNGYQAIFIDSSSQFRLVIRLKARAVALAFFVYIFFKIN